MAAKRFPLRNKVSKIFRIPTFSNNQWNLPLQYSRRNRCNWNWHQNATIMYRAPRLHAPPWYVSYLVISSFLVNWVAFLTAWSAISTLRKKLFKTFLIKARSAWQWKKSASSRMGLSALWLTSGTSTLFTTQFLPVL